jgi:hypothetical protein
LARNFLEGIRLNSEDQWWVINGRDLMNALEEAERGTDAGIVYLELIANSEAAEDGPSTV